jgi:3',5'-cyclic AMP phosphodiesterase CpdA
MRDDPRDAAVALVAAILVACTPAADGTGDGAAAPTPLTVAFIGDQGLTSEARAVLELIEAEGADLVLHLGDLDYADDPAAWDAMITDALGADFPLFVAIGNHDEQRWYGPSGYQERQEARLARVPEATCRGELGVRAACTFRGLFFILSGIGTMPKVPDDPEHVDYLRDQLARADAIWRVCAWHRNQRLMQVGGKDDDVGWQPYEACREGGAIVATAHEHSYSRTHLMDSFASQSIASTSDTLIIDEGQTSPSSRAWAGTASGTRSWAARGGRRSTPRIRAPTSARCSARSSRGASPSARAAISRTSRATSPTASS